MIVEKQGNTVKYIADQASKMPDRFNELLKIIDDCPNCKEKLRGINN